MYKIDNETVRRILDTADIVDVVSDFVSLKRRGANYIGLCPFHNERTPSFSVSKSKGICKCFSCGKGGSPVNFIMLHEQMTYQEALRYLAKKYNIDIKEHELTDKERAEETERESLFAVNEFALEHFRHNMSDTAEGQNVGLAYFRERGINDAMVEKFKLGYSIDRRDDLLYAARSKGYSEKYLIDTGLIGKTDRGDLYDRFRGRVIYPVFTISGKVVAFGGRRLSADRPGGKYVNSPESVIYSKRRELYGLYQAKPAIVKKDKCILVEGYMDVISMFQNGIENVVASSGTSLTEEQIRLIHRFTNNITVIYDSDPAGIKASLRGIDMLLAEGLSVKVLQLPEGDDPDSFSQSHSASEVEQYLNSHEIDFIKFKTNILLDGVENDPIKRSKVISDIVVSISVIPDPIQRDAYIKECSYALNADERILANEVQKCIIQLKEQDYKKKLAESARKSAIEGTIYDESKPKTEDKGDENKTVPDNNTVDNPQPIQDVFQVSGRISSSTDIESFLEPFERQVIRYAIKYGMAPIIDPDVDNNDSDETDETSSSYRVIDYIREELESDEITFANQKYSQLFNNALALSDSWIADEAAFNKRCLDERATRWEEGENNIRLTATTTEEINIARKKLQEECDNEYTEKIRDYAINYIVRNLSSSSDDNARNLTIDLATDRYTLSKIHSKFAHIEEEKDLLKKLVPRAIFELRDAILRSRIHAVSAELKSVYTSDPANSEKIMELMKQLAEMKQLESQFARLMGDRVVIPHSRRR